MKTVQGSAFLAQQAAHALPCRKEEEDTFN